ncbi:hypothetical protein QO034_18885 [Sedimentitalea sp. JM2-8]|uniref:Uncharacterized protein n=1 Tax=Sedimentitalea xiamensis TaxID=3050037 RepID=A0ABT7FJ43_9RHOB|nr:hypothetical protein [Sedimentitalea xiamensis]MDK3075158.1 hypothetical protein [Sedimentitalea xiamensis]
MKRLLLSALAALIAQTTTVSAQDNCAPRDDVIAHLAGEYGETRYSLGLESRGLLMELFVNRTTGTWTLTAVAPSGIACLVASGDAFQSVGGDT